MEENHKDKGKRYKVMAGIDQVFSDSITSKKIFGNDGFQFFLFQKRWKNIVGDMLAKESYIKSWKDDTLVIAVTNSVFLQHLFMMKGDLLKRLSEDEFGKRFKDIRFIAGPRQKKEKAYSTLDPVNHKIEEEQKMTEVLKIRKGEAAAGYKPCAWCGALFDQKDKNQKLCPNCQRIFDRNIKHRAVLLLKKYPHYTFQQVRSIIGCGYSEYEEARDISSTDTKKTYSRNTAEPKKKENSSPSSSTNPSTKSQNRKQKTSSSTCLRKNGTEKGKSRSYDEMYNHLVTAPFSIGIFH